MCPVIIITKAYHAQNNYQDKMDKKKINDICRKEHMKLVQPQSHLKWDTN